MVTRGYKRLQRVTEVTGGKGVTGSYNGLLIKRGYRGVQAVAETYKGLQGVKGGYKG